MRGSTTRHIFMQSNTQQTRIRWMGPTAPETCYQLFALGFLSVQITLSESIFDVGEWVETCLKHKFRPVVDYVAALRETFDRQLDQSLSNTQLRESYRAMYEVMWLWYQKRQPSIDVSQESFGQRCLMMHNVLSLRLVNDYVRFNHQLQTIDLLDIPSTDEPLLFAQAILALGQVSFLATFVANPRIGTQYIWKKHELFFSRLRRLLSRRLRDGRLLNEGLFQIPHENCLLGLTGSAPPGNSGYQG